MVGILWSACGRESVWDGSLLLARSTSHGNGIQGWEAKVDIVTLPLGAEIYQWLCCVQREVNIQQGWVQHSRPESIAV